MMLNFHFSLMKYPNNIQRNRLRRGGGGYLILNCTLTFPFTIKTWKNCQKYAKISEITILLSQGQKLELIGVIFATAAGYS